jgi:hypothetical protein
VGVLGTVSALGWLALLGLASAACGARSGLSLAVDSCAHPTAEICDGLGRHALLAPESRPEARGRRSRRIA